MSWWVTGIGAALAVAGAGASSYGTSKQNRKANKVLQDSLVQSTGLTDESADELMDLIKQYETPTRETNQSEAANYAALAMANPVNESQINRADEQGATGDVSNDYTDYKSGRDALTLADIADTAQKKANVIGAQRLRQNESYKLADVGADINARTAKNNRQLKVGQVKAQDIASQRNAWQNGGQIASLIGNAMMLAGGISGLSSAAPAATTAGTTAGTAAGNTGLTAAGDTLLNGATNGTAYSLANSGWGTAGGKLLQSAAAQTPSVTGGIGRVVLTSIPSVLSGITKR